jgi:hypothetical protein
MKKFNCKHDWEISKEYHIGHNGEESSVVHCEKCGIDITINEAIQIELWKHTTGFQKWLAIIAIFISVASLVISFLK